MLFYEVIAASLNNAVSTNEPAMDIERADAISAEGV